jgi:hypothetical protein
VLRGSGSVVEHHLAKVRVAGSNPVFRSNGTPCYAGGSCIFSVERVFSFAHHAHPFADQVRGGDVSIYE